MQKIAFFLLRVSLNLGSIPQYYNVSLATEEDSKRIHIGPSLLNIYVLFMLQKSGICMQTMIM